MQARVGYLSHQVRILLKRREVQQKKIAGVIREPSTNPSNRATRLLPTTNSLRFLEIPLNIHDVFHLPHNLRHLFRHLLIGFFRFA